MATQAKRNTIPPRLRRRAERIIKDTQAHDRETREAVAYALKNDPPDDLAETIRTAERGGEICDTRRADDDTCDAARLAKRLLAHRGTPRFITDALMLALTTAAAQAGAKIHDAAAADLDTRALADLFTIKAGTRHGVELEPKKDLAEMLSAVLTHPDCPTELYNAVGDCDFTTPARWDTPEHLRLALADFKEGRK
jgi:hypothetical protein